MVTRSRVLSFMSQFSSNREQSTSPTPPHRSKTEPVQNEPQRQTPIQPTPSSSNQTPAGNGSSNDAPLRQRERAASSGSRPMSMIQTYHPPVMDVSQDTIPELQPIFTFLNSHANKLYQEGYFLKLDDQNTMGRPNADRTWTECFAQLVGTVLSLWDAAELDAAGQDGEVLPKFINLTDASIKMIESLPTRSPNEAPLQNVLSISTAGKNRYLLHFNSHHSLIQWTAGIRLAMFEHATLQEAYTGALIAGKGKTLNNINVILERARMPTADWARVRFGAGTPWRRCWCVITPPDEKEVQKLQKQMGKKKSAYDRSPPPTLKGDIKFYDTKKTKKQRPIATISDAYSAFAIYPQSKPLIDASTLVKLEGSITIHSNPPSTTEGFVFVMPEAHPAVSGFEILLRWLFPAFDTFALYGRPTRLIADINDTRSLMFAMPKHRRYGYLEILDVTGLILEQGSSSWRESEWRKRMKELTAKRMKAIENGSRRESRNGSRRSARHSYGPNRSRVQFDDGASIRSSPSITWNHQAQIDGTTAAIPRVDSAPPAAEAFATPKSFGKLQQQHHRSVSETAGLDRFQNMDNPQYEIKSEQGPPPPPHLIGVASQRDGRQPDFVGTPERLSSEDENPARSTPVKELQDLQTPSTPEPVAAPPAFSHAPGTLPITKPYHSPELRKANSRMSNATLSQLAGASGVVATYQTTEDYRRQQGSRASEDNGQRGVMSDANIKESSNQSGPYEGIAAQPDRGRFSFESSPLRPSGSPTRHTHPEPAFPIPLPSDPRSQPDNVRHETLPEATSTEHTHPIKPVYGHSTQPSTDSTQSTISSRNNNRQSITRKPLPPRGSSTDDYRSVNRSSFPLGQPVLDQASYDRMRQSDQPYASATESLPRHNSGISSNYDDENSSTVSPDYASTRRSFDNRQSVDKPRAGVMRTVGHTEDDTHTTEPLVPTIDFGPTRNYTTAPPKPLPLPPSGKQSPGLGPNNSHFDRPASRQSYGARPESAGHSRSPSRIMIPNENQHSRNDSAGSRMIAWQPGMVSSGSNSPGARQSITPEEFVQQRAATSRPWYAHQKQASSGTIMRGATPPLVRNRSSEMLTQGLHSRSNSTDLLQRPSSRGPSVALGQGYHSHDNSTDMLQRPSSRGANTHLGSGDITSKLSAREQEHVARVTGQPLISMVQNRRDSQGAGLVGHIQQRELDKQQAKQGLNSQAVQHAINQRQQQHQQQQHQQQHQAYAQSQYGGNMSQVQQRALLQQQQPQQQSWKSPAHAAYWAASPTSAVPQDFNRQSPSYSQGQGQQQYFPTQQPQQIQQGRRPNTGGYHGHAN